MILEHPTQPTETRNWTRVRASQPCPVCGKTKGCIILQNGLVHCLRVASDSPVAWGLRGWQHRLSPLFVPSESLAPLISSARRADPATLNLIYTRLLKEHPLLERHQLHLTKKRGLTREAYERRGYRSWGWARHARSPIARQLVQDFGGAAVDTPGIIIRKQGERAEYATLAGAPGLAIPVRNADELIVGIQLLVDNPQPGAGKYTWLSSSSQGGAKSGTPVHVARPQTPSLTGRVWLTEGPLKADIACERLGEIVVAVPGVNALKELIPTLTRLLERGDLKELVVALDSDWHSNEKVAQARELIAERAGRLGIPVWLADWDTACKGLDDLLQAGGRPRLETFQVGGSGPRTPEFDQEVEELEPDTRPRYTLEEARQRQDDFIWQALTTKKKPGECDLGYLIRTLPGTGKSHAITRAINRLIKRLGRQRVRVAGFIPRHELANEPGREDWANVRGRTHSAPDLATPCTLSDKQKRLVQLRVTGQQGCQHCTHQEACRSNTQRGSETPFYLNQLEVKAPIKLYPSQHFMTPSVWSDANIVFMDDCSLTDLCLENVSLSRTELESAMRWSEAHPDHLYNLAQPLLLLLLELTKSAPVDYFDWSAEALFSRLITLAQQHGIELDEVLRQAQRCQEPDPFSGTDLLRSRLDTPKRFIHDLVEVLHWELGQWNTRSQREVIGWNRRVRLERPRDTGEVTLTLKLRQALPLKALRDKVLIVLDASMTLEEAKLLFPDRRWIELDLQVKMPDSVTIHQNIDQNWGLTRLRDPRFQAQALQLIEATLKRHPGQKTAVITHKSFGGIVKKHFGERVEVGHYYGQRGSNRFADCTLQICFGTPHPNMEQVERQAEALHWDGPILNRQTVLQGRHHRSRKGKPAVRSSVRTYRDQRLQRMLRSKREDELLQAAFRARPLSVKGWFDLNPTGQGRLNLFDVQAPQGERTEATIYIFSSLALPSLEVNIEASEPKSTTVKILDFEAAAREIRERRERLTISGVAQQARTKTYQVRRWLASLDLTAAASTPHAAHAP